MNHRDVEQARQIVILQANVLQKLAKQSRTTEDERKELDKEIIRLRKLASRLVDIVKGLTPKSFKSDEATRAAMKNWNPPPMSCK